MFYLIFLLHINWPVFDLFILIYSKEIIWSYTNNYYFECYPDLDLGTYKFLAVLTNDHATGGQLN